MITSTPDFYFFKNFTINLVSVIEDYSPSRNKKQGVDADPFPAIDPLE
ncbi:hypothetical protein [Ammoniphilus sp. YIM 78166]|nr:hypothetical protein [Ammoniphilus sp. YIM 78166]